MLKHVPFSDEAVLAEFGKRIENLRLSNNWTQAELANKAGVGKSTIEHIEKGRSTQFLNMLKVLRAFGLVNQFVNIIPKPSPSPMELLAQSRNEQIRKPKRASKRKKQAQLYQREPFNSSEFTPANVLAEPKSKWIWDEDK